MQDVHTPVSFVHAVQFEGQFLQVLSLKYYPDEQTTHFPVDVILPGHVQSPEDARVIGLIQLLHDDLLVHLEHPAAQVKQFFTLELQNVAPVHVRQSLPEALI